jgi:hypothetical protein
MTMTPSERPVYIRFTPKGKKLAAVLRELSRTPEGRQVLRDEGWVPPGTDEETVAMLRRWGADI